ARRADRAREVRWRSHPDVRADSAGGADRSTHQPGGSDGRAHGVVVACLRTCGGAGMRILVRAAYTIALPAVLIGIWWAATLIATSFYVPEPGELWTTGVDTWAGERFGSDVLPSLTRFLIGTAAAIVLGVAFGLLIGSVRWVRQLTEPLLEFFRAIPPPVLVPVLMLIVGVNDQMK